MRGIIHIDRLLLKGFGRVDGGDVADGLRRELGRLLAEPGGIAALRSMNSVPRLQVDKVQIKHGAKSGQIGERVARRIGAGFVR